MNSMGMQAFESNPDVVAAKRRFGDVASPVPTDRRTPSGQFIQTPEYVRAAYVAIAYLGLRVGEYLRLKDTDLLPATKQVRVPGSKTAASTAVLPVDDAMWEWVRRAVPSPLGYKWLHQHWYRARQAVGAGDVRLHDLRHLTAQALVNAGRSEASVQNTMRHATASMTRRYARQRDRGENAKTMAEVRLASA